MHKVLIFNDTSRYQHFGCDLVMESIFTNLLSRGLRCVSVHRVGTSVDKRFDEIMRRHADAAGVIVNGEGVIHHDRKHARGLASIARRAREHGLPAHLINATLFANSPDLYRDLRHFNSVHVREGLSLDEARAHDIDARCVPDLSFDAISRMLPLPEGRRAVLVSDSVHDQQTAELRRIAADLRATWAPMRRRMPVPLTRLRKLGAHRFVRRVARSACVLTGRFHTVTISIATGTPFFATTSNTPKIEAVLRDVFGNTNRIRRSAKQARAALESERVMFDEAELRAISAYLNQSQDGTRRMFDAIAGVA